MPIREKVKRAFHRSDSFTRPTTNCNGVKIEYYKRHEIPHSKFRGPFDREHQRRLAAWSFETAQEDRPRSPDLSLSPCATIPLRPPTRPEIFDNNDANVEQSDEGVSDLFDNSAITTHDEYAKSGSQSSTAVGSNASIMVLPLDSYPAGSIACIKKTTFHPLPVVESSSKLKRMPFAVGDLSRALHVVRI